MTATIELLTDAAAELVPERTVIGVRGVRALRPLAVDPEITLHIEATAKPGDGELTVVSVVVDGTADGARETYARGTVLLADAYPAPPALREAPLAGERDPGVNADQLYADRWMFHGPAYQAVTELSTLAEDGVRGVVEAMPAPGALLDAAGQLLGFWVATQPRERPGPARHHRVGVLLRSTAAGRAPGSAAWSGFARPPPRRPSRTSTCATRTAACGATSPGWTDRRLEGDAPTIEAFRTRPARCWRASRTAAGGCWPSRGPIPTARDLAARQYLPGPNVPLRAARNPRRRATVAAGPDHGQGRPAQRAVATWRRPAVPGAGHRGQRPVRSAVRDRGGSRGPRAVTGALRAVRGRPGGTRRRASGSTWNCSTMPPRESALLTAEERHLLDTVVPADSAPRGVGHPVLDREGGRGQGTGHRPGRAPRPICGDCGER